MISNQRKNEIADLMVGWQAEGLGYHDLRRACWALFPEPDDGRLFCELEAMVESGIRLDPDAGPPSGPVAEDEDPHRFTTGDLLTLSDKLQAHRHWADLLAMENEFLKSKAKGPLDPRVVAFVGCLWRKNILSPLGEPGAVPFDAVTKFFRRDNSMLKRAPSDLQIGAALRVLEGVGFLKRCRRAVTRGEAERMSAKPQCATYALADRERWEVPT